MRTRALMSGLLGGLLLTGCGLETSPSWIWWIRNRRISFAGGTK